MVELIPGITCDGYVLNDGTAVMSERGTADLLGMNQMALHEDYFASKNNKTLYYYLFREIRSALHSRNK